MSIEFLLGLVVILCSMAALAWLYCKIFDFVGEWKARLRERDREKVRESAVDALKQGRLPPMVYGQPE